VKPAGIEFQTVLALALVPLLVCQSCPSPVT
jgi:hypothetical protein